MNFKKLLIIFSLIILVSGCVDGGDSTISKPIQTDEDIVLGKVSSQSLSSRYFKGNIDELIIYDRALTLSEVEKLYTLEEVPTPVMYLNFNTDWYEGIKYHVYGPTRTDDAKSGKSFNFRGSGNYVLVKHDSKLSSDSQSISLWIKPTSAGLRGLRGILFKAPDTGLSREIGLLIEDGIIRYSISDGDQLHKVKSSKRTNANVWTHIVIVKEQESGVTKLTLYQDKLTNTITLSGSEQKQSVSESDVSDFLADSIKDDFAKGRLESDDYIGLSLGDLTDDQLQQVQYSEFAQFLPYSPEWRAFADERGISYNTPSDLGNYGFDPCIYDVGALQSLGRGPEHLMANSACA